MTVASARIRSAYASAIWVRRAVAGVAIWVAGAAIACLRLAVGIAAVLLVVVAGHACRACCGDSKDVSEGRNSAVREMRKRRKDAQSGAIRIMCGANVGSDAN